MITQNPIGEQFDDGELEDELERMQQEHLDEQMLNTGQVPTTDAVHKMPTPSHAERKYTPSDLKSENGADIQKAISSKKVAVEDDEEAELLKLQAEMAM